jgi:hypothetical protein
MKHNIQRRVFLAVWILLGLPAGRAEIIAYASAGAGELGAARDWGGLGTATGTAAAFALGGAQTNHQGTSLSGPTYEDLFNLICVACTSDARATGNGISGAAKVYGASGLVSPFGGQTLSQLEMFDTITFGSATATINMDLFYQELFNTAPDSTVFPWTSSSFLQVYFVLVPLAEEADGYVGAIEVFDRLEQRVHQRGFQICNGLQVSCVDGTVLPASGHYSYSATIDTAAFQGQAVSAYFRVMATTQCEHSSTDGDCLAILNATGTAYLGLQGDFTSANGYQYLGVPSASAVPEPGTYLLSGLALMLGAAWRRSRRS